MEPCRHHRDEREIMAGLGAALREMVRTGGMPAPGRRIHTPLIDVTPSGAKGYRVVAKIEALNPGLSVKDRVGRHLVERALAGAGGGHVPVLVEASSGNTAVGVAMAARENGARALLFVPEDTSPGRIARMRAFGAGVVLTPAPEGTAGARMRAAQASAADPGLLYLDQHSSILNPETHRRLTGPEIAAQLGGLAPDALVVSVGTGGTLLGLFAELSGAFPGMEPTAVVPSGSAGIPGMRAIDPEAVPLHAGLAGMPVLEVDPEEAAWWAARVLEASRVPVGPSSGAAMAGAARVGELSGGLVVTLFPDHGFNYV
jgi:cysteine synthase